MTEESIVFSFYHLLLCRLWGSGNHSQPPTRAACNIRIITLRILAVVPVLLLRFGIDLGLERLGIGIGVRIVIVGIGKGGTEDGSTHKSGTPPPPPVIPVISPVIPVISPSAVSVMRGTDDA